MRRKHYVNKGTLTLQGTKEMKYGAVCCFCCWWWAAAVFTTAACCFLWLNEHQGHFRADVTIDLRARMGSHQLAIIENNKQLPAFVLSTLKVKVGYAWGKIIWHLNTCMHWGQVENGNKLVWGSGNVAGGRDRVTECDTFFLSVSQWAHSSISDLDLSSYGG